MSFGARSSVLRAVVLGACVMHVSSARSDESASSPRSPGGALAVAPAPPAASACPADMREVEGTFCPFLDQVCIKRPVAMSYRCS